MSEKAYNTIKHPNDEYAVLVSIEFVDCPLTGNIKYHIKDSDETHLVVVVDNHKEGIATLEVMGSSSEWLAMSRNQNNEFVVAITEPLSSPLSFRISSVYGEELIDRDVCSLYYSNMHVCEDQSTYFLLLLFYSIG